jgi:hypothetical protein
MSDCIDCGSGITMGCNASADPDHCDACVARRETKALRAALAKAEEREGRLIALEAKVFARLAATEKERDSAKAEWDKAAAFRERETARALVAEQERDEARGILTATNALYGQDPWPDAAEQVPASARSKLERLDAMENYIGVVQEALRALLREPDFGEAHRKVESLVSALPPYEVTVHGKAMQLVADRLAAVEKERGEARAERDAARAGCAEFEGHVDRLLAQVATLMRERDEVERELFAAGRDAKHCSQSACVRSLAIECEDRKAKLAALELVRR